MILSQNTSTPIERVAAGATGPLWAQFYPQRDPDTGREFLDRAQAAGCRAIRPQRVSPDARAARQFK